MAYNINKNKPRSTSNRNSRMVQGGRTDIYNNRLGWWEKRQIPKQDDDYKVRILEFEEGRPDLISYRVYGKAIYAWLILQYNNIVDPATELVAGKTIMLPTQKRLILDIMTKPTGGNKK